MSDHLKERIIASRKAAATQRRMKEARARLIREKALAENAREAAQPQCDSSVVGESAD